MKRSLFLFVLLCFPIFANATTFYVDGNLVADCVGGAGTSYSIANRDCSASDGTLGYNMLNDANSALHKGDIAYLRAGTYDVIGTNSIDPDNIGDAQNIITYSGYESETVTVRGKTDDTGYNAIAIRLIARSYIKVTKINFTNFRQFIYISGSDHNEISYCSFYNSRNPYTDKLFVSGTITANDQTGMVATHAAAGSATYSGYLLINTTDQSSCEIRTSTTTTNTCVDPLWLGADNQFQIGDSYEIRLGFYYGISYIRDSSTHNWIHNNSIYNMGGYTSADGGVGLQVGIENSTTDVSDYNTIENNVMYAAGHHVLGVNSGKYDVIKNNYIHNEAWYSSGSTYYNGCNRWASAECGYRVVSAAAGANYGGNALWEKNKISYGAKEGGHLGSPTNTGSSGSGTSLATSYNIYRFNDHADNALYGLRISSSVSAGVGNRIYSNSFYHNGWNASEEAALAGILTAYRTGLYLASSTACTTSDIALKNNLFFDHWATTQTSPARSPIYPFNDVAACNHNMGGETDTVDPLFTDITLCQTRPCTDSSKPDLTLQVGSPAIDGGTYLTQANGSGTGSLTLIVDDARYFQDGSWGSSLARGVTLQSDWIAIGTVGNVVRIASINYATNTITLNTAMTWADNANIWLYKNSDGEIVLYGAAPDYGAHEYGSSTNPSIAITVPTTSNSYNTDQATIAMAGTATPVSPATIASNACVNNRGGTCTTTGTTSWTVASCDLSVGNNDISCTTTDSDKLTNVALLRVNRYGFSSISSGTPTQTGATITWTTNPAGNSQVEYGLTNSYGLSTTLDASSVTSHSVALSGLSPNTEYHYRVITAGFTSVDGTFTTAAGDVTPIISSVVVAVDLNTATVSWTTDEASDTKIIYGLTAAYGASSTISESVTSHSITIRGLTAGTVYHFTVTSTRLGNTGTVSDATFTTGVSGRGAQ